MNLFRKHSISILSKDWKPIKQGFKMRYIPRHGELIFLEETNRYYKVLNVVYYLNSKSGVFIIVDEFGEEIAKV